MRTRHFAGTLLLAVTACGCSIGDDRDSYVIPGPTVPSRVQTASPNVWDTDTELGVWVHNPVSRNIALSGTGAGAQIVIDTPQREWALRGPDLVPPQRLRAVRITYRWVPAAEYRFTPSASVVVETVEPVSSQVPHQQPASGLVVQPGTEWRTIDVAVPGYPIQDRGPVEVRYVYLHAGGWPPGTFTIDRIELIP